MSQEMEDKMGHAVLDWKLHFFRGKDDLCVFIQFFLQVFDYTAVTD